MQKAALSATEQRSAQTVGTADAQAGDMTVVYDGDCPVCTAYTCNIAVNRSHGAVNAREGGALVDDLTAKGFDLDEGMVVIREGRYYHGADAVHMMALHSNRRGLLGKLNYLVFRSPARSRALYPILRVGRNLLLRILGRKKINKK